MFIGYLNTRKELGYECLIDTQCGNKRVLITDLSVLFVKNVTLDGKRKIFVIIVVMTILFSDVKYAQAIGISISPQQTVVNTPYRDTSRLIKPSQIKINLDIKPKIMMPSLSNSIRSVRIRTKSDLQNSQWIKDRKSVV